MKEYKIGELAELVNINIDTIRYYEKIGMIPKPNRDINEYRTYSEKYINILQFIILCKNNGFKLKEIKEIIDLLNIRDRDNNKLQSIIGLKVEDIESKINELKNLKNQLKDLLKECLLGHCTLDDFVK